MAERPPPRQDAQIDKSNVIYVMLMTGLLLRVVCTLVMLASPLALLAQDGRNRQDRVAALEAQTQKYLQEQKPAQAIPLLREITNLDPKNLNARANLGVLLFFQGNYPDAIPQMRKALDLKPDLWKIQALLGIAEKRTGDSGAAQTDLEAAFPHLEDKKIQKEAGLELVELNSSLGEFTRALAVTEKLQNLLPEDPEVLFVAYEISSQMMDQSLLNMMLVAPDSPEMHMMMGGALGRRGDRTGAIAQYREAIRLNPKLPGVHFELGEQLRTSTDPVLNAEAEGEFKAAIEVNRYDTRAWLRLGEIMTAKNDFKQAIDDFNKALAVQPHDSDAETDLAIALISMNQTAKALPLLESAVKEDPTNSVAHYRLALLYRHDGKIADSRHEMELFLHYKGIKDKLNKIFLQMEPQTTPK